MNINRGECVKIGENLSNIENDKLLDELYQYTQTEEERELTVDETKRYVEIVDYCHDNHISIGFGIII